MSVQTLSPAYGDFDEEFAAIVAAFDEPAEELARVFRPTRAAERREAREAINLQLGIRRHRSNEREV